MSAPPGRQPQRATFDDFLIEAVNEALVKAFDASTAKAVGFYVDPHILANNPDAYADSVLRMFGKAGGEVVLNSITKTITQKANMPPDTKWRSLRDCVTTVAKRFRPA